MKDAFLIGSFLPGYSGVFRYTSFSKAVVRAFSHQKLADRFAERSERFQRYATRRQIRLQMGLLLSLAVTILAIRVPLSFNSTFDVVEVQQELVAIEEIQQTRQQTLPPPPPRPPVPIEVPDDVVLEETELNLDAALDLDAEIVKLGPPPAPPVEESVENEHEVFVVVENPPEMIGGFAALMKAVEYPVIARRAALEGTVVVQLIVDEKGEPVDPFVVKSVAPSLDEAALKAVRKQRFKPGMQRGRPVKVQIAIPVIFRLNN